MRAIESTKRKLELQGSIWRREVLKTRGSEDHQKLTSSEAPSTEVLPQKLEDWKLQSLFKCYYHAYHCRRNISLKQRLIQRNLKSLNAYSTLEKDNSTIVQLLSPLLWCVSAIVQEQQLWLRWYSSIHGMDLKLFLHRKITQSSNRSLVIWSSFKQLFFDVLAINNVSFTPLYKEVKT